MVVDLIHTGMLECTACAAGHYASVEGDNQWCNGFQANSSLLHPFINAHRSHLRGCVLAQLVSVFGHYTSRRLDSDFDVQLLDRICQVH